MSKPLCPAPFFLHPNVGVRVYKHTSLIFGKTILKVKHTLSSKFVLSTKELL